MGSRVHTDVVTEREDPASFVEQSQEKKTRLWAGAAKARTRTRNGFALPESRDLDDYADVVATANDAEALRVRL